MIGPLPDGFDGRGRPVTVGARVRVSEPTHPLHGREGIAVMRGRDAAAHLFQVDFGDEELHFFNRSLLEFIPGTSA